MTKSTPSNNLQSEQDDAVLNDLYKNRKHNKMAPPHLKQQVFAGIASKTAQPKAWWKINMGQYAQISAVTACLAVVVLVVGVQMMGTQVNPLPSKESAVVYSSIQIHDFIHTDKAQNTQIANSQEQKINYDKAYAELLAKQQNVIQLHQTLARVVQYNGELHLLTCDDELLKISQDVVNMLYPNTSKTIDFSQGKMLALRFDKKGHIVDMRTKINQTQC